MLQKDKYAQYEEPACSCHLAAEPRPYQSHKNLLQQSQTLSPLRCVRIAQKLSILEDAEVKQIGFVEEWEIKAVSYDNRAKPWGTTTPRHFLPF